MQFGLELLEKKISSTQGEQEKQEQVVLVNECDEIVGVKDKLEAHQLGLLHRAFSVFLLREGKAGLETLLQQRQKDKYHCGGLWSNACCSHPRLNESILEAGKRRLKEELGVVADLSAVGSFVYIAHFDNGLTEHEFDHVLMGRCALSEKEIRFNPEEVEACRWVTFSDLKQLLLDSPEHFTPWFQRALDLICEKMGAIK